MYFVYFVYVVAFMVVCLRLIRRRWWCTCGSWWPVTLQAAGPHTSQHFADAYSATHAIHGLLLYGFVLSVGVQSSYQLIAVAIAEAAWEVLENTDWIINRYRQATVSRGYVGDSVCNSIGDVLLCLSGAYFASLAPVWASVTLAVTIELLLLLTIRDSLFLNILMLSYPIEAIRYWQKGGNSENRTNSDLSRGEDGR